MVDDLVTRDRGGTRPLERIQRFALPGADAAGDRDRDRPRHGLGCLVGLGLVAGRLVGVDGRLRHRFIARGCLGVGGRLGFELDLGRSVRLRCRGVLELRLGGCLGLAAPARAPASGSATASASGSALPRPPALQRPRSPAPQPPRPRLRKRLGLGNCLGLGRGRRVVVERQRGRLVGPPDPAGKTSSERLRFGVRCTDSPPSARGSGSTPSSTRFSESDRRRRSASTSRMSTLTASPCETTSRGFSTWCCASSEMCTSPSTPGRISTKAPKVTTLVTRPSTTSFSE